MHLVNNWHFIFQHYPEEALFLPRQSFWQINNSSDVFTVVLSPLFIALTGRDKISLWRRKAKNLSVRTAAPKKKRSDFEVIPVNFML